MKLSCHNITDSSSSTFVPRRIFEPPTNKPLWATINSGAYPPVEIKALLSEDSYPGLDGKYIYILIDPHQTSLNRGDVLSLGRWITYIAEIE